MAIGTQYLSFALLALIASLTTIPLASAVNTPSYCSSQNTGLDTDAFFWTWQSNGKCGDHCRADYAYAVILDKQCWCSNYAPAEQVDLSDCSQDCPGFPSEKCGNPTDKLYIYVALDIQPSGTQGAAKSSIQPSSRPMSSTAEPPSLAPPSSVISISEASEQSPETVVKTVTAPAPAPVLSSTTSQSSVTSTTLQTSTTREAPISTPTPIQSVRTITQNNGATVRETIIISPPTGTGAPVAGKKSSTPAGAIAGGVVGGLAGLALIIGAIVFFLRKRRQQQEVEAQSGIQRNTSTMSRNGLLGHREKPNPPVLTTNLNRNSRIGFDHDSVSPVSGSDRRSSRPYIFDQRLNPSAIMAMDNTSRGSIGSLDDSRDYGRELNVRNPDPDPPELTRP